MAEYKVHWALFVGLLIIDLSTSFLCLFFHCFQFTCTTKKTHESVDIFLPVLDHTLYLKCMLNKEKQQCLCYFSIPVLISFFPLLHMIGRQYSSDNDC